MATTNLRKIDKHRFRKTYPFNRQAPQEIYLTSSNFLDSPTVVTSSVTVNTGTWDLVTGTEQGASPFDPSSLALTGTTFVPATGQFFCNFSSSAITIDGYHENMIRWTARVLDIYPNFNPRTDVIQMFVTASIPRSTARHGFAWGILDGGTGSISSQSGSMFNINGVNTNAMQFGVMASGTTTNTNNMTEIQGGFTSMFFTEKTGQGSSTSIQARSLIKSSSGEWADGASATAESGLMVTSSLNWRFHFGFVHASTATGQTQMTASVYTKLIKSGSTPPFI